VSDIECKTNFSRRLKQFDGFTRLTLPPFLRQIYVTDDTDDTDHRRPSDRHDNDAAAVAAASRAWYDQRRAYRQLRHQKCSAFWAQKVESERAQPAKLWRSVDQLLGRGRVPVTSSIDVETINNFFVDKVDKVRASTDNVPPPTFTHAIAGSSLYEFCTLSAQSLEVFRQRLKTFVFTRSYPNIFI